MNGSPPAGTITFRVGRVRVELHPSMLIVMTLVAVVMATSLLPDDKPAGAYTTGEYWLLGVLCALSLPISAAVHEVAHLVAERLRGRRLDRLPLVFLHSSHSPLPEADTRPWGELLVAVAGPTATFTFAAACFGAERLLAGQRVAEPVLEFVVVTNLLIGALHLVPAHPLDGGRALRAVAWGLAGDPNAGTRWAARVSLALAIALGVTCMAAVVVSGFAAVWIWGALLAIVLGMQSVAVAHLARTRERMTGLVVSQVMEPLPDALPRVVSVADALASASAAAATASAFLVEFQGRLGGIVTAVALRSVPEEERWQTPVGQVMRRLERQHLLDPAMRLEQAFRRMSEEDLPMLPVLASGRLVGVLRQESVLGALAPPNRR